MKKSLGFLLVILALLTACNNEASLDNKNTKVELTKVEIEETKDNPNLAAQLLIKKAILKEMKNAKYTEKDKKELAKAKENTEIEYYLNKKADGMFFVDDDEVLTIYKNNNAQFKNVAPEQALVFIKNQLYSQKLMNERAKYINMLADKYEINETLKKMYPEIENTNENNDKEKVKENKEGNVESKVNKETKEKVEKNK